MRWLPHLIALLVFAAVAAGLLVFIRGRLPKTAVGQQFTTYAKLRDGSKLVVGSPVVIAGVRIGEVTQLAIEGRFARVDLRLRDDTDVGVDSIVTKRAPSTFGDSYIEILPSGGDEGATNERRLVSGEPLTHVLESSSTDAVLRATERSMPRFELALAALHDFMSGGRAWVNGVVLGGLQSVDLWLEEGHLHNPLADTDAALDKIEAATNAAAKALGGRDNAMISGLANAEARVRSLREGIATSRQSLDDGMVNARRSLDTVDQQLAQAHDVMAAIDEGSGADWKGQLGRLINEHELVDSIEDGTESARDAAASFNHFKAYLGVRIEAAVLSRLTRTYVTAEIRAHDDKFYLIELEKGLLGGAPNDNLSDAAGTTAYTRTLSIQDKLRFTAQFGMIYGPIVVRGGIEESTFGAGVDFMSGRLKLSADAFGSFSRKPDLKFAAAIMLFRSMYLVGGVDDTLNKGGYLAITHANADIGNQLERVRFGRDYFIGAQLRFNDEDITTLLRVYGALLASAL